MLNRDQPATEARRSRARPGPLAALFVARRRFDEARLALYRATALWVAGERPYDTLKDAQDALVAAQAALFEAIEDHRGVVDNLANSARPDRRFWGPGM